MRIPSYPGAKELKDSILGSLRGRKLKPLPKGLENIRFTEASYVSTPADPVGTNPCGEIPLGHVQQCTLGQVENWEPPREPEPVKAEKLKSFDPLW